MDEKKIDGPSMNDVSYQVMPKKGGASIQPKAVPNQSAESVPVPAPVMQSSGGMGAMGYSIVALVVLLILGGLAYYFLGGKLFGTKAVDQTPVSSRLPKPWLSEHFTVETCNDQSVCGDSADPDKDGYDNYSEFVANTDPMSADSDSDGLADGDEMNIYHTDPLQKYTDKRDIAVQSGFTDGASIKNGYDPLTPGSKFTETRLAQIRDSIAQFQLHAPTTSTLNITPAGNTSVNPEAGGTAPNPTPSGTPDTTK